MSKVSLSEFAAQGRPRTCGPCTQLPEEVLAELNEGLRSGIGSTLTTRWLASEGFKLSVEHHKRERHHP